MIVRPAAPSDLPALTGLAKQLDTVNLPHDPAVVEKLIGESVQAFAALTGSVAGDFDQRHAHYTLIAAEDDGAVLGTASLFAYHGMPDEPHYYLKVERTRAESRQLGETRERTLLSLGRDIEPWTELGGLVVHPEARGKGIGKLLVAARLLLVAMHPARFCRRLLAELLPPRRPDGGNAFWDAVGGPLTGLDYYRADLLCRTDKEFIEAFFPHTELVGELLPPAARDLIAQVGDHTAPVRSLLQRAGFRWLGTIDPFDAGPHDGALIESITPIVRTRRLVRLDLPPTTAVATADGATDGDALVAEGTTHRFRRCPVQAIHEGLRLGTDDARQLGIAAGDPGWVMPMDW